MCLSPPLYLTVSLPLSGCRTHCAMGEKKACPTSLSQSKRNRDSSTKQKSVKPCEGTDLTLVIWFMDSSVTGLITHFPHLDISPLFAFLPLGFSSCLGLFTFLPLWRCSFTLGRRANGWPLILLLQPGRAGWRHRAILRNRIKGEKVQKYKRGIGQRVTTRGRKPRKGIMKKRWNAWEVWHVISCSLAEGEKCCVKMGECDRLALSPCAALPVLQIWRWWIRQRCWLLVRIKLCSWKL